MKYIKALICIVLVGFGVAITYYFFELGAAKTIDYIWGNLLNTNTARLMVIPACLGLGLLFFGTQHLLDKKSEHQVNEHLGEMPPATVNNFLKVLFIGFLSLVAGASLGPEAILVPACMILGAYAASKLFKNQPGVAKIMAMAGFVALCTAFFDSIIIGLLSLLLITKQAKIKPTPQLFTVAVIATLSCFLALKLIHTHAYVETPTYDWMINWATLSWLPLFAVCGFIVTYAIGMFLNGFNELRRLLGKQPWWFHAVVAGSGLAFLYIIGGTLVEFTGNQSIKPMLQQSAELGIYSLVWILLVKIAAIAWSKTLGYRGGLIFPTIFIASVIVAIALQINGNINFMYGLLAIMFGVMAANSRLKVLI